MNKSTEDYLKKWIYSTHPTNLDAAQKKGIEKGLKDIDKGRVLPHDEVRKKYGL